MDRTRPAAAVARAVARRLIRNNNNIIIITITTITILVLCAEADLTFRPARRLQLRQWPLLPPDTIPVTAALQQLLLVVPSR